MESLIAGAFLDFPFPPHTLSRDPPMSRRTRTSLALIAVILLSPAASAQGLIRLARTPDISPDGKLVAFSYLGDIWTVATGGGTARPVTSHSAHDINPVFSPDGRHLAFASNRHGSYDVFVVPVGGGRPTRLTFDSAADFPCGWSPDGKHVLFASSRSMAFPPTWALYTVPLKGGRVRRIGADEAKEGIFSPKGDLLACVRGPGTWFRKYYRGAANDDIWICRADGTGSRRLTHFLGQDGSPMWSADGRTLYYVSEFHGTANIVYQPAAPPAAESEGKPVRPTQITFHKDEGVRRARISADGKWIVYECGADLWVVSTRAGAEPHKLAIEAYADDKSNDEHVVTLTSGASEFAISPDEKYIAFAVHGKLFRMPVSPTGKVTRMTFGGSNDHGMAWSPDGSKIIFISDRNGHDNLYLLESDDPDQPRLTKASHFKVKQLTNSREAESGVTFAPNGKVVTFLRGGRLWSMKPDGSDAKLLVDAPLVVDYAWSPDAHWIAYARRDGSFASELYIIPALGRRPPSRCARSPAPLASRGG
jgi:tricorn protease